MIPNALLADSLRKWKEDAAPHELKLYAKRECNAGTGWLLYSLMPSRDPESIPLRRTWFVRYLHLASNSVVRAIVGERASVAFAQKHPSNSHDEEKGSDSPSGQIRAK